MPATTTTLEMDVESQYPLQSSCLHRKLSQLAGKWINQYTGHSLTSYIKSYGEFSLLEFYFEKPSQQVFSLQWYQTDNRKILFWPAINQHSEKQ